MSFRVGCAVALVCVMAWLLVPLVADQPPNPAGPPQATAALYVAKWGKFRMLILKQDPPSFTFPGNAGTTQEVR